MDIADVLTIIGNYAFPIACCIYMFKALDKERSDHKDEVKQMTAAVNNNTTVLKQILTKIGGDIDG